MNITNYNKLEFYLIDSISKIVNPQLEFLFEGGAVKHMAHPFDFTNTGIELIDVFEKSIESLKKGNAAVKIDGINASIRFVNGSFALDRGSAKPLDIKGVKLADLEDRFEPNSGLIYIGRRVIHIFDTARPRITDELNKLGMTKNPNLLLNIEFVEGKSNVIQYSNIKNFLAIHGMNEMYVTTVDAKGNPKSRSSREISYDKSAMDMMIEKLQPAAEKYGFKILGSISTTFTSEPNLAIPLSKKISIKYSTGLVTKRLSDWLKTTSIPHPMITKSQFQSIFTDTPVDTIYTDPRELEKMVNGAIVYLATIMLGDEILSKLTSSLGDVKEQEGVVIRDNSIHNAPFKITGSFIIKGMESRFR